METDWVYPDALSLLLLLYLQNQHTHTHIHACMHTMISMAIKQTVNFDILRKSHIIIYFYVQNHYWKVRGWQMTEEWLLIIPAMTRWGLEKEEEEGGRNEGNTRTRGRRNEVVSTTILMMQWWWLFINCVNKNHCTLWGEKKRKKISLLLIISIRQRHKAPKRKTKTKNPKD